MSEETALFLGFVAMVWVIALAAIVINARSMQGKMEDEKIFNYLLSDEEVEELYRVYTSLNE
tara:strand:- start:196 stop:381 length:186 start_codon:yes stop_codon:yes gene_type:complete